MKEKYIFADTVAIAVAGIERSLSGLKRISRIYLYHCVRSNANTHTVAHSIQ